MSRHELTPATTKLTKLIDCRVLDVISDGQKLETVFSEDPEAFPSLLNSFGVDIIGCPSRHHRGIERVVCYRLGQIITAQEQGVEVLSVLRQSNVKR